jgi:chromatin segregation and condensation protein Rec8/ScpA/Scc1 (kleisin family)
MMSASEKGKSSTATGADASPSREPEEIREDIEQTREELGDTVAAMAEKTDVKKQAQAKAEELKGQATAKARELGDKAKEIAPESAGEGMQQAQRIAQENPMPMALAGTFVAGFLLGRLFSR